MRITDRVQKLEQQNEGACMTRPETIAAAEDFTRRMNMHPAGRATTVPQFQATIRQISDPVLTAIFLSARASDDQAGVKA